MKTVSLDSPNLNICPVTAKTNASGHLEIGGCDTVELAERFGTPLWIIDQATIVAAVNAYKEPLSRYQGESLVLYAGKSFLCLAMCHLIKHLKIGLDVVSGGELYTALQAGLPAQSIYLHGNNKSEEEIKAALDAGPMRIVIDNESELHMVAQLAAAAGKQASILLRITPGVEPDTHQHIKTGGYDSKFGIVPAQLPALAEKISKAGKTLDFLGIHAHIGSQSHELEPYEDIIAILADQAAMLASRFKLPVRELNVGGGLGITYTATDKACAISAWTEMVCQGVAKTFAAKNLPAPRLLVEPGRSIIGPAGVTLYRAGHMKRVPSGTTYLAVDGGMADNPRPITYGARYTAACANRMGENQKSEPLTIVGKYCESGDVLVSDVQLAAESGDLIAVFATGAYNYSMSSNYNRTPRPACILVHNGKADLIVERESTSDLLRNDRVPDHLR